MRGRFRTLNNLLGGAISIYGNLDIGKPLRMRSKSFKEFILRFYHLTHIGLVMSLITFLYGLIISHRKRNKAITWPIFEALYIDLLALTITTELFIPIIFWTLWVVDAGNVVETENYFGEDSISLFFNMCMHGIPSIFLLIEFFLSDFIPSRAHYLELLVFFLFYIGIMQLFYNSTGSWPYKIIEKFTGLSRWIFFGNCLLMLFFLYWILSSTYSRITRVSTVLEDDVEERKQTKKNAPKSSKRKQKEP
ncbi:hypothetical protein NEFER03_2120 [Nematocida sp. LUAm3]|nr:hypothetical protein NEFER03_2120 [Nematocida sp. LUAm3]KAI5175628.1 hypothetical protein NEFER02_1515 [Nematocida sp. LUAm2]KAI5178534.1 hypothetical protein NEFER01_1670 [Nematocida sp. LUAm1]